MPCSENAVMTECFDRQMAEGVDVLTVLTVLEDTQYLNQPFITSTHDTRETNPSAWMPAPCE